VLLILQIDGLVVAVELERGWSLLSSSAVGAGSVAKRRLVRAEAREHVWWLDRVRAPVAVVKRDTVDAAECDGGWCRAPTDEGPASVAETS